MCIYVTKWSCQCEAWVMGQKHVLVCIVKQHRMIKTDYLERVGWQQPPAVFDMMFVLDIHHPFLYITTCIKLPRALEWSAGHQTAYQQQDIVISIQMITELEGRNYCMKSVFCSEESLKLDHQLLLTCELHVSGSFAQVWLSHNAQEFKWCPAKQHRTRNLQRHLPNKTIFYRN